MTGLLIADFGPLVVTMARMESQGFWRFVNWNAMERA